MQKRPQFLHFLGCDYYHCYYDYGDDDDDDVGDDDDDDDDGDDDDHGYYYYYYYYYLLLLPQLTSTKVPGKTDASALYTAMMNWTNTTLRFFFFLIKTTKWKKPFIIVIFRVLFTYLS